MDFVTASFNKEELKQKVAQNTTDSRKKQNSWLIFLQMAIQEDDQ